MDTHIIGAGLAGLVAAKQLADRGQQVRVVDKGRSVGGRLATRRMGAAVLDHGAQFFTARSDDFNAAVADWIGAGVVEEWCRGFEIEGDGYPRYRAVGGMNQLAKHLRSTLPDTVEVLTGHRAASIIPLADRYAISYDGAIRSPDESRAVICTAPVPQALELIAYARRERPDLHIVARARDRTHVFQLFNAGANDIVREMFDSSLRAGRYVLENIGLSEYEAAEAQRMFYAHDRVSLRELAELWKPDIPASQNAAYVARAKELETSLRTRVLRPKMANPPNAAPASASSDAAPTAAPPRGGTAAPRTPGAL